MPQEVLAQSDHVVNALKNGLAARIGQQRFDLWFGPQIRWRVNGDAIVVTAPNDFVLDCLRRQFATEIRSVLENVGGETLRAEFRADTSRDAAKNRDLPAKNLDSTGKSIASPTVSSSVPSTPFQLQRVPHSRPDKSSGADSQTARRRWNSLSSFVVGEGNRVAFTAAEAVVQRPGSMSPLFLYGPPGTGKTHLLEAVCSAVRASGRTQRALLLSAEQFTCCFLEALQGSGLPNFRRKCRDVDLLVIDDIQFLASGKKTATLLEFQHTIDALTRQGRQLVVSSDRAPKELTSFGSELVNRLTGGLVCGVTWADYETRLGITRQFAHADGNHVAEEVVRLIASETSGDARQIRGALNRIGATSRAYQRPITLELARDTLYDLFASAHRMVRLPDVERAVCEVLGMEVKSLREGRKSKSHSQPRMLAMWLARKYTRAAFSEIGEYFGKRSHSTVISAERKVNGWVATSQKLQLGTTSWPVDEAIRRIETKLRTG